MQTITFQNRSGYAKSFTRQSGGQLPLVVGPSKPGLYSSADFTVDQFLCYFEDLKGYTTRKRDIDGNGVLLLVTDTGLAELTCEQLLQGMVDGHMGPEAQAKAVKFVEQSKIAAAAAAAWAQEQRAMLTGQALRAQ